MSREAIREWFGLGPRPGISDRWRPERIRAERPVTVLRRDLVVEDVFVIDGCSISASCLTCPLEKCRYEMGGGGIRAARNITRDRSIRASRAKGTLPAEIAKSFGISRRTVWRVLAEEAA